MIKKFKRWLTPNLSFETLRKRPQVFLYAGDVPPNAVYDKFTGLSLQQANLRHIRHDVTRTIPLPDSSVDIYQAEDVFEHIELARLPAVIDEIYRVLKPGGVFRLSVPDYRCDILDRRTLRDASGRLAFDPQGGGAYVDGRVVDGGHLWFPTYDAVNELLQKTHFTSIEFFHYYDGDGNPVTHPIDYSIGYVQRTPDHDDRVRAPYRPMSIVVDCVK